LNLVKELAITTPSIEQQIMPAWDNANNVQLWVKRDDLIHPIISGNKWRKLSHALQSAVDNQCRHIVSFGGGFSNHLHALGYCCQKLGIRLTAIVRGDYSANPSPMLADLLNWQTDIQYVNRITYQKRTDNDYLNTLQQTYPDALIIPEGGSQQQALVGMADVIAELTQHYDYIVAPVASGGTLAGLVYANNQQKLNSRVLGIAVLKGQGYLERLVSDLLPQSVKNPPDWQINHDYHCGGYAKSPSYLQTFCTAFFNHTQIPVEPVYSGKIFYALQQLISQNYFSENSKILALHTGGLQGNR
jgi:1-aminocyclopropane-1-carboxylate deaminase